MRMTEQRKKIMHVLESADKPLTCETIFSSISDDKLNLSTIYRSLETFYDMKLVLKTIINQKQFYYVGHHHHFLVCLTCQDMIAVNCHVIDKEKAIGEPYGFEVTHHDMILYGYCQSCQH